MNLAEWVLVTFLLLLMCYAAFAPERADGFDKPR